MTGETRLESVPVPGWPKLAWVLAVDRERSATVFHGSAVETRADWIFEGVWDGEFERGDFDQSDLVFGSGVRRRGDDLVCVGSSSTLDRLWMLDDGEKQWVSNTLPGVLAASGASLDLNYSRYRGDIESVVFGLKDYRRQLPLAVGRIEVVYFDNLRVGRGEINREAKPDIAAEWASYAEYRTFLRDAAKRIGDNARASGRATPVEIVATISSGYDSTASAVVAREAGARVAFTIGRARALIPRSDSGEAVARALGLDCRTFKPPGTATPHEEWFLAALGWSMDFNLAAFDFPGDRLTLLFTGFHGDKFWDLHEGKPNRDIVRGDASGLGLTEFRLLAGVVNCAVPFWGVRNAAAAKAIMRSGEMAPWTLGTSYDRPIPRRVVEEAGVPRQAFGQRKSATTIDGHVYWPLTAKADSRFRAHLRERGQRPAPVWLARLVNQVDLSVLLPLRDRLRSRRPRIWFPVPQGELLFAWAVTFLAGEMAAALRQVTCEPARHRNTPDASLPARHRLAD